MPCLAQETLGSSPWAEVGPQLDPLQPGGGKKWAGLSETPAEVRGVGSAGEHPASSPTSSFTDKKKVAWSGVTFQGSPSKWGPPVRLGLVSGGAGQVACSLGWHRPGAGGDRLARTGGEGGPLPFGLFRAAPLFSLCFPSARPPPPSRLPLIVRRAIKGQMSGRSLAAVGHLAQTRWRRVGGRGAPHPWPPGQDLGSPPATQRAPLRSFARGSQNPFGNPGRKAR